MRLPRLTTRRLMVAVALVGVTLGTWTWMGRRSRGFRDRSIYHGFAWAELAQSRRRNPEDDLDGPLEEPPLSRYHRAMGVKYRLASKYPWLPVTPDPEEPD